MPIVATTLLVTLAAAVGMWLLSLALRNAAIVDSFWGPGFLLICVVAMQLGGAGTERALLMLVLVAFWSLRLAIYLTWRNHGKPEDYRYARMRAHHGNAFWWRSLFTVFGLQGVLMWIISAPLQAAILATEPQQLGALDYGGIALWTVGFGFESIGDWQLSRFKADPANAQQVMDRGLWRYTRHPNYFGDALVWWGYGLIALATPYGAIALIGPAIMTFFLLRVSGLAMLERDIGDRRPGYAEYVQRTSAFFPRPPDEA